MKRIFLSLTALALSVGLWAQFNVQGYVYNDTNKNGKKDNNEKGIARVAVSDGKQVVLTDRQGKYQLSTGNDNIIFVVKPAGYRFKNNAYQLPEFYKIIKPNGSPATHYAGVKPTDKPAKYINFGLEPVNEPEIFTALVFGDPQPYDLNQVGYFKRAIVDDVLQNGNHNALLGISLGDIVGDDLTLHQPYKEAMAHLGISWYNVMGNHDMNYDTKTDSLSDESFEAHFGPNNYAFNYGKAHFIVLDDILYPDPRDGKGYWGGFRNDQLAFVENDLRLQDSSKLIVISLHIPLADKESGTEAFRQEDRLKLYKLLDKFENVLVLSAHTHIQYQALVNEELQLNRKKPIHEFNAGATCGDWYSGAFNNNGLPITTMRDGTPQGYSFLNINGNQYSIDYKVSGMPESYKMTLSAPKVVPHNSYGSDYYVYANIFMATENDKVEYRIDNGNWKKMTRVLQPDPGYARYVQDWDFTDQLVPGRRPSEPVNCLRLWQGELSVRLNTGNHQIDVRTTDMFGRELLQQTTYRIEPEPVVK